MNKHDFEDYYQAKFDDNALLFAESREEEFEDFCWNKFVQLGVDRDED
jgi:hypothetical protein